MKLRNKILAFATPAAAVATVMPMTLTACSVEVTTPVWFLGYEAEAAKFEIGGTEKVGKNYKFIFTGIDAEYLPQGSNRITIECTPKGADKPLDPKYITANGKSLTMKKVKNDAGDEVWVGDSTEALPTTDFNIGTAFNGTGDECKIYIYIGKASDSNK